MKFLAPMFLLCLSAVSLAMPPLTGEQRVRLETAHDGRDHQEEAFLALVENMRAWDGVIGDVPVRLEPDVDTMVAEPDRYRGEVVRLAGRVAQTTALPRPYDGVLECFLRDDRNQPVLVYIVEREGDDAQAVLRDGAQVEVFARFYKRVDFTARDGRARSYAAFVGAYPRRLGPPASGTMEIAFLAVISVGLLAMLIVFALLFYAIRRQRGQLRRASSPRLDRETVPPELDDPAHLPDDPADALAELRRRIEE